MKYIGFSDVETCEMCDKDYNAESLDIQYFFYLFVGFSKGVMANGLPCAQ